MASSSHPARMSQKCQALLTHSDPVTGPPSGEAAKAITPGRQNESEQNVTESLTCCHAGRQNASIGSKSQRAGSRCPRLARRAAERTPYAKVSAQETAQWAVSKKFCPREGASAEGGRVPGPRAAASSSAVRRTAEPQIPNAFLRAATRRRETGIFSSTPLRVSSSVPPATVSTSSTMARFTR